MNNAANKQELVIVHPLENREKPEPDFWALLSFIKSSRIDCQLILARLSRECSPNVQGLIEKANIKNGLVYFHISDITYLNKMATVLSQLKENDSLIIAGGHLSLSLESEKLLETFKSIDIIIRVPEVEKVLVSLTRRIFQGRNWGTIRGISYRHSSKGKRIIVNQNRSLSKNLDHLSNLGIYNQNITGYEWYPIILSRGCDNDCQYCGSQLPYRTGYDKDKTSWRKKSEKKVVDEIEFLVSKGICKFNFYCDRFFGSRQGHHLSAPAIAGEILNRKLKLKFKFAAKAGDLKNNLQTLFTLNEAGLEEIHIGIDSGIPRFHKMYNSGSTVEDCIDVLSFMHENRFKFNIAFIFYDPFLTIEGIRENIIFLDRIKEFFSHLDFPYSAYLDSRILSSALILQHGMPIIRELRKSGILVEYPDYSAHPAAVFLDPMVKDVYRVHRMINETFLPKIRHFFYDKELAGRYGFIDLFPLRLFEKVFDSVLENKFSNIKEYKEEIESFIKNTFVFCNQERCQAKKKKP